jgi:thiol-disulfide isomerase/thioredoxin
MKRIFPMIGLCAIGGAAFGQLPVNTAAENKNVVLEEFTGIHCTYCPDGHLRANQLAAANPGNVVLINIHTGGYANPSAGELDFRTAFGDAIGGQTGLTGYPAGTVNRRNFPGSEMGAAGTTGMGRGDWAPNAPTVLAEASYVNLALESSIDASTRVLTVDVEMFETGTAPATYNLNVALLQNGIEEAQTGSSANPSQELPNGDYVHNHAFRDFVTTGQWGEVITSAAGVQTRQYTMTLPADINGIPVVLGDLEVVAFIAEGQQNIITGEDGPVIYTNLASDDAAAENVVAPAEICGTTVDASFTLINSGGNAITAATIEYGFAGQTPTSMNWTGNLATFGSESVNLTGVAVPGAGGTLTITVTDVNGGTDSNAANNSTTAPVSITSNEGQGTDYTFTMTQDRYGSEITWNIKDDNGATLASGGPYSDLAASGTQDHVVNFTASATGCHEVTIVDSYGDGFNAGYGVGGYDLKVTTNGVTVLSSNGQVGSGEEKPFNISSLAVGVEENNISALNVYPNPVSDVATVEFEAVNADNVSMIVTNSVGAVVMNDFTVANGVNRITVDCANLTSGLYFVTFTSNGQNIVKKFNVIK